MGTRGGGGGGGGVGVGGGGGGRGTRAVGLVVFGLLLLRGGDGGRR